MGKKIKNILKHDPNPIEVSSSSTVFKSLFGEITEQSAASNSIFSDNNPFRRKLAEANPQVELGSTEEASERKGNLGDSDLSKPRKEKKRSKDVENEECLDLDVESVERKGKKLRRAELKGTEQNENKNSTFGSKEALDKDTEQFSGNAVSNGTGDQIGKKKKKRKRDEVEAEYEAKRYGVVHEIKENEGEGNVLGVKRKKMDNPEDTMVSKEGFDDEIKLLRTVFVGNLPLTLKKKEILKEFDKFGEVESIRIRSVPVVDGKIPRKGAVIKKQINDNADSVHAYIVFKTEESAQASLSHNMAVIGGNHIRVDRACPPRKKLKGDNTPMYDNKRTVFVGNLPFDVKDEEIYQLFSGLKNLESSIEAVRVIRDPGSSLGKGIAYVLFKTTDAANLVAKKHNLKLRDRLLRLSHAKSTNTPSKRERSSQSEANSPRAKKSNVGYGDTMNAKANLSYQGLQARKSGGQKKVHRTNSIPAKSKSHPATEEQMSGGKKKKRPAVAARKEKARRAANASSHLAGTKRKHSSNHTPQAGGQKKKARKFR